jgi:hypothetical protein
MNDKPPTQYASPPLLEVAIEFPSPTVFEWTDLSGALMESAALFARDAYVIEVEHGSSEPPTGTAARHRALVLSGIVAASAAVEAYANDIFLRALDGRFSHQLFDSAALSQLRVEWEGLEKKQPLPKLQLALKRAGLEEFQEGAQPFQDSNRAFKLRSHFAHAHSVATDRPRTRDEKLASDLRNCTINSAPWFRRSQSNEILPQRYISHDWLEWAICSHLRLLDVFTERTKTPNFRVNRLLETQ